MYKNLGLSSEEVREIGKFKNSQAFNDHYLQLGAPGKASSVLDSLLHNLVSPCSETEPDRSLAPARKPEVGGSDGEGRAQDNGSPNPRIASGFPADS